MKKIVINTCFGGFSLSDAAIEYMALCGHRESKIAIIEHDFQMILDREDEDDSYFQDSSCLSYYLDLIDREDPYLVDAVENLGPFASGYYSRLRIVEIPDDVNWVLDDYDGVESIHEAHRVWR